jgi:small ligand-binding sensory domain FIST
VGEVVGQVLERLDPEPDLAVVVVSPGHAGALEDAAGAVRALLRPGVLVGWASTEVAAAYPRPPAGPWRSRPAVGLWAGHVGAARPVRGPGGPPPPARAGAPATGTVLLVGTFAAADPGFAGGAVVGCRSDVAGAPVVLDDVLRSDGWVGAGWPAGDAVLPLSFEGHRPIGPIVAVTGADGPIIHALAGHPAMELLDRVARDHVPAADIPLINRSVHLEVVGGGPPVAVRGRDRASGGLALDRAVAEGEQVVFCVLDPDDAVGSAVSQVEGAAGALVWDTTDPAPRSAGVGAAGAAGATVLSCSAAQLLGAPGAASHHGGIVALAFGPDPGS